MASWTTDIRPALRIAAGAPITTNSTRYAPNDVVTYTAFQMIAATRRPRSPPWMPPIR
ncbi:MAG TPA: hypothetical protein VJT49_11215 [Amycolatopsis sp.]|uniref:hypothetical protein n=1 Tax=Amycolatopsis sp. TaxID=37632 RepID=UPI002B4AAAC5|nr:hypothetical protein [Amycolatopsis sp.]HKS45660.1 hypothetical protein [Amycolatopsis sp.]